MTRDELRSGLSEFAREFDGVFAELLRATKGVPDELSAAVEYSALGPGKRIRPFLAVRCCELVGAPREDGWAVASAVECIHAFSLIHDDLPAMDDDDLRRGRPTCHKQFGEAMAILAGDALAILAFEIVGRHAGGGSLAARLIGELAEATGPAGMIGGQAADISGQSKAPEVKLVQFIHARKTAVLFEAACRMGAMAGRGGETEIEALGRFGYHFGLAFQIADDLLDVTGVAGAVGKRVRKDEKANKQTFPRCVGVEASRVEAGRAVQAALSHLDSFGPEADDLRALTKYAGSRDY